MTYSDKHCHMYLNTKEHFVKQMRLLSEGVYIRSSFCITSITHHEMFFCRIVVDTRYLNQRSHSPGRMTSSIHLPLAASKSSAASVSTAPLLLNNGATDWPRSVSPSQSKPRPGSPGQSKPRPGSPSQSKTQ